MAQTSKYGSRVTGDGQYVPEPATRSEAKMKRLASEIGVRPPRYGEQPFSGGPNDRPFPPRYGETQMAKLEADARDVYMKCVKEAEVVKGGYLNEHEKKSIKVLVEKAFHDGGATQNMLMEAKRRIDRGLPTEGIWKKVTDDGLNPLRFDEEQLRKLADIPTLKRGVGGSFPLGEVPSPPQPDEYAGLTTEQREILAGMEG